MSSQYSQNCIDAFCHFMPTGYYEAARKSVRHLPVMLERCRHIPAMVDLEQRKRILEEFPNYRQVISLPGPPPETLFGKKSTELTKISNDELAKVVLSSSGTILGFVASLPLNDPEAAVAEARRAIVDLGAVGVQIYTSVNGTPIDCPVFKPLYRQVSELDRPILLHPTKSIEVADYPTEKFSKYDLWWALGWPMETTLALVRLAISGVLEQFSKLRILAHHVGGYLPMLAGRLGPGMQLFGSRDSSKLTTQQCASKNQNRSFLLKACKSFFADTASFGSQEAIECGQAFFSTEHLLFATDMPFDPGGGPDYIRSTLNAIECMDLSVQERSKVLTKNAIKFFNL